MNVEKRIINGTPELFIDGEMTSRTFGRLAEPGYSGPEKLDQYTEAGLKIFITSIHEANDWCWDGADGYDYETYEAHIAPLVEKMPDIKLIPFVGGRLGAPYLWCKNHLDQVVIREDGTQPKIGSFGSAKWFADSIEAVRRFVEHFENSPWADNIIGYNPIYMNNEWACKSDVGSFGDFSKPMLECFCAFLRERYQDDEAALRKAWKDNRVTFETAAIPTGEERLAWNHVGQFHYLETHGLKVADYYRCYNERVADFAIALCQTVKDATAGKKLAGMMHLYNYCSPDHATNGSIHGHCASRKLLAADCIDFFHSPYEYLNRSFGGVHYSQNAHDAITAAGKLHLDQIDTKTYIHKQPNTNCKNPWETWQVLKRDVANSLTRNSHHYYYEMSVGCFRGFSHPSDWRDLTYLAPDISGWIAQLTRLAGRAQPLAPEHIADAAIVTSTEGHYVRAHIQGISELYNNGFRQHVLPYSGAPFADYILEDIDRVQRKQKLYFFPNAYNVPTSVCEALHAKLKADGATAVWFYAPGYATEFGASLDHIEALTGFRMQKHDDYHGFLQIDVTDFDHPVTRGLQGETFGACTQDPGDGCTFGSDLDPEWFRARQEWGGFQYDREKYKFCPAFSVDDPGARVLGTLRGVDAPGFAVKEMDGWTSVYIAAPFPPWKLISNLLRFAGGHLYSNRQDVVYANSRYIALQANGDGTRTLSLPGPATLRDAFDGSVLAVSVTSHRLELKHGEVAFLEVSGSISPGKDGPRFQSGGNVFVECRAG